MPDVFFSWATVSSFDLVVPCYTTARVFVKCVVLAYELNCVENENQRVSTQGKIHEYSYAFGCISALTNQNAF